MGEGLEVHQPETMTDPEDGADFHQRRGREIVMEEKIIETVEARQKSIKKDSSLSSKRNVKSNLHVSIK